MTLCVVLLFHINFKVICQYHLILQLCFTSITVSLTFFNVWTIERIVQGRGGCWKLFGLPPFHRGEIFHTHTICFVS